MYRLLKDLVDWKGNFYIKCKCRKSSVQFRFGATCVFIGLLCISESSAVQLGPNRVTFGRSANEHGLFRHDRPSQSLDKSKSDFTSSTSDTTHQFTSCLGAHDCKTSDAGQSPKDHREKYTYERFKRSVTTLNFHPKPKNQSRNVGVKPLRIFKYITDEDPSAKPHSSERHVTVFQPIVTANLKKKALEEKNKGETVDNNDTSSLQQIIGGAKINLKSKLDKAADNYKNHQVNDSDNMKNHKIEVSEPSSIPIKKGASPKPENVLIFKPSVVIRKGNNKASLIPSGNHPPKDHSLSVGSNSIIPSTRAAPPESNVNDDASVDPNSSSVTDRSQIPSNVYFDSIVTLNEEGQKQLGELHQAIDSHRENGRKSSSEKYNDNDEGGDNKIKSTTTPSSSFSSESSSEHSHGIAVSRTNEKKISPTLSALNSTSINSNRKDIEDRKEGSGASGTNASSSSKSKKSDLVEKLIDKIDATIAGNKNIKDRVIVTVVKSKKSKSEKKGKKASVKKQQDLDRDDTGEDGSERSRRSPFKMPTKFHLPGSLSPNNNPFAKGNQMNRGQNQLVRAALFRRNPVMTRIRTTPIITNKKVFPRVLSPSPLARITAGKTPLVARTIIPMKQMPMLPGMHQAPQNMALVAGPVGPGPVGPPIAAIKITNMESLKNGNHQVGKLIPAPMITGKDLMADASRTVYSYKPVADDAALNQAASSYYSPTYKSFQNRFQSQIADMVESQRALEDTIQDWEESRYPTRHLPPSKHRSRHSPRHHRERERDRERVRHTERERDRYERKERIRERDRPSHGTRRNGHHHNHPPPHPRHPPIRGKKLGPKYTYPKNAENIQDILKYFDKDAPRGGPLSASFEKGPTNPNRQQSVLPSGNDHGIPAHPKLADLSGEFRDVHASLLKDIREFAKRPNMMYGSSSDKHDKAHGHSSSHGFDSREPPSPFDPIDEIFGPKPKPVRDLIKPDLYSLENIRERIALKRGKLHGKFRDRDGGSSSLRDDDHDDRRPHSDVDDDTFYDSHRPSRHNSEGTQSGENPKNSLFSKEEFDYPSRDKKREKEKDIDDAHSIFPSSHFRDKESIKENSNPFEYNSGEFTEKGSHRNSHTKPIILKRPSEPFRVRDAEPKKKPEHDYFWNTFPNTPPSVNYDAPLVLKSPTPAVAQAYNPFNSFGNPVNGLPHALSKHLSVEDEDIVEIHTGAPGSSLTGFPPPSTADLKQDRLKKMYMNVLQQKLQLEAALLHPHQSLPTMHPTLQHHPPPSIHSLHASPSMQQQHNPLQIPRLGHPAQMAQYSSVPAVTLPPMTGLGGVTRRKKPMRMKIHIYPNGNDGIEQGIEAANLLAAGGFGATGFSASNPIPSAVPPKESGLNKPSESAMPSGPPGPIPTSPSGFGGTGSSGPMGPITTKNKNVVLHLHVHRRNDMEPLELEAQGSAPVPATAKPLMYKDIFDDEMKKSEHHRDSRLSNHRQVDEEDEPSQSTQDTQEELPTTANSEGERDKSVSMEVPIHDEKIEDVFHSIMKYRKKPDNRKKRS